MRGAVLVLTAVGLAGLGCGAGDLFPAHREAHEGCDCSLEVPGLWTQLDLLEDQEVFEYGFMAADRYVFAEFLPSDEVAVGVDLVTFNDHFISDDIEFDPSAPPDRETIDGHPAVLRWIRDTSSVEDMGIQGVFTTVAYPDGFLRMYAWSAESDADARDVLLGTVRSVQRTRTPEAPALDLPVSEQPHLDAWRAAAGDLPNSGAPFEWGAVDPPDGLVETSYEVPADADLGPAQATRLRAFATPVQDDGVRRSALVVLESLHGTSDDVDAAMSTLAESGEVVVFRPFLRGGPEQPGTWDLLGSELLDVAAAVRHVAARPDVDPERIVLVGGGVGGGRVVLAMTAVDGIWAGYALDPPADLPHLRESFADLWGDMPYDGSDPRQDELRSPVRFTGQLRGSVVVLSTQYSDLVGERALYLAAAATTPGTVTVVPMDRMGIESWGAMVETIGAHVAREELPMDPDTWTEWADTWWREQAPQLEKDIAARVAAMDRVGVLSAVGIRDYVVETRGSIDQRVAYELAKQALAGDRAPGSSAAPKPVAKRSRPGPLSVPRPEARTGRVGAPGPALRVAGRQLRDGNLLVRFGSEGGLDALLAEMHEGKLDGYVAVHTEDIEIAGSDGYLPVLYGAQVEGADATRDLGRRVAATLRQAGLTVEWNDDPSRAVMVVLPWAPDQPPSAPPELPAPVPSLMPAPGPR